MGHAANAAANSLLDFSKAIVVLLVNPGTGLVHAGTQKFKEGRLRDSINADCQRANTLDFWRKPAEEHPLGAGTHCHSSHGRGGACNFCGVEL